MVTQFFRKISEMNIFMDTPLYEWVGQEAETVIRRDDSETTQNYEFICRGEMRAQVQTFPFAGNWI